MINKILIIYNSKKSDMKCFAQGYEEGLELPCLILWLLPLLNLILQSAIPASFMLFFCFCYLVWSCLTEAISTFSVQWQHLRSSSREEQEAVREAMCKGMCLWLCVCEPVKQTS